MPNIKMFFKSKKVEPKKEDSALNQDLAIITKINQEFATSLDLNETLQTALEVIIKRLNAQAANIFLIDEKKSTNGIATQPTQNPITANSLASPRPIPSLFLTFL